MLFSQFVEDCKMLDVIESLVEQWDMAEWDPPAEDELTGGITRDAGPRRQSAGRSKYQRTATRSGAGEGSIVVMQDPNGKASLGVITQASGGRAVVTDPRRGTKRTVSIDALQPAKDGELTKQIAAKYPNRSIWRLIPGWNK